jgi:hypothetical protein
MSHCYVDISLGEPNIGALIITRTVSHVTICLTFTDSDNNPIDEAEDAELDMGDLDSSLDMVARLFRMSITSGILCQPALPAKV